MPNEPPIVKTDDDARARLLRPWRIALVVYAVILTTSTHWPRLVLPPEIPLTDKLVHLAAFGLLATLLWRAHLIRWTWLVIAVTIAWAAVDEVSQGLPGLNRWVSAKDSLANTLGVLTVGVWLWALAPLGGTASRRRLALRSVAFARLFTRKAIWIALGALAAACAVPPAISALVAAEATTRAWVTAALIVSTGGAAAIVLAAWHRETAAARSLRVCFACGAPCRDVAFDGGDEAACPACGAALASGQWSDPVQPTAALLLARAWRAAVMTALAAGAGFAALLLAAAVNVRLLDAELPPGIRPRLESLMVWVPPDLRSAFAAVAVLHLAAIFVRFWRRERARQDDRDRNLPRRAAVDS